MAICIVDGNRAEYVKRVGSRLKKYLKNNPNLNETAALKVLYANVLKNKGEAFAEVVNTAIEEIIGGDLADSYFFNDKIRLPSRAQQAKIKGSGSVMIDAVYAEIKNANNKYNDDDTITDDDIVDNESDKSIGDAGIGDFDQNFFSAVGERLYSQEFKKIYLKVKESVNFDKFKDWIDKKWNIMQKKNPELRLRNLLKFYTANNAINSIKSENVFEVQWLNFDDSVEIKNYDKDIPKAIISGHKFIDKIQYNLKDKADESPYSAKHFVDELTVDEANVRGIKMSRVTGYFNLNRSGTLIPKNGDWFFKEGSSKLDLNTIRNWEYGLSNFVNSKGQASPYVMIAMLPGDTGKIVLTRVQGAHVEALFPKDAIVKALRAYKIKDKKSPTIEKRADEIEALDISIATWFKDLEFKILKLGANKTNQKNIADYSEYLIIKDIIDKIGRENWETHLNTQVAKGYMTSAQKDMQMESIDHPAMNRNHEFKTSLPIHLSGLLAKHEWLQSVRGNDYMRAEEGNTYHLATRLKLSLSKGLATEGLGDSTHIIYNKNDVEYYYNGEKVEHLRDIPGIGLKNIVDGASFGSFEYIRSQANAIGSYPISAYEYISKEIKSVYSQISKDNKGETSYIEKKHALFEAPVGLEVWKKGTYGRKNSRAIVKVEEGRIVDRNGDSIDEFSDDDAVKTITGKYKQLSKNGEKFVLKEKSRRIIKTPKNKSNDTVSGPVQILSALNYNVQGMDKALRAQFEKYQKAFTGMLIEQSEIYNKEFIKASDDPNVLRRLMKFVYSRVGEKKDAFRKKLTATGGIGIHHPDNWTVLRDFVLNMLIGKGSMQSRTYHPKISPEAEKGIYGSNYVLKPDIKNELEDDQSIILSADNRVIFDRVKKMSKKKTVDEVNEWLSENPQKVITYRYPILHISAIEVRTIKRFEENGGNTIIHHPNDVFRRLIGDHDIDEAGVMLIGDHYAEIFEEFHKSDFYKNQLVNPNLDMFKKLAGKLIDIADINASRLSIIDMSRGLNAQALASNMKSIASTLSMRFNNIKFSDGVVVRPKKLTDKVLMDYAPIDMKNFDQDNLPPGASVERNADGNYYLRTTFDHEALLIVNAATDHTNKKLRGMLSNVWGMQNPDWFVRRMFHIKGKLTDKHIDMLKKLNDNYKYSPVKSLRNPETGRKLKLPKVMGNLQSMWDKLHGRLIDHKIKLMNDIRYEKDIGDQTGSQVLLRFEDLEMNDVITPDEQVILNLIDILEGQDEEGKVHPFGYPPERYEVTHYMAREQLWEEMEDANYSNEDLKDGHTFAMNFAKEFYGLAKKRKQIKMGEIKDDSIKIKLPEYNEDMFNIVKKFIPQFNKLSENAQKVSTISLISGLDFRINISYLPPLEVLHESIYVDYMQKWEDAFFKEENGVLKSLMFEKNPEILRGMQGKKLPIALRIQKERC